MNNEIEAYPGELKELREKVKLYEKIFVHSFSADKVGNIYFISGQAGSVDENGLPEQIFICPAYGLDWFQIYQRTDKTEGPEY